MPSLLDRIAERILPSRESIHYLLAKTHYQWALHSANFGSEYWFQKARDGFESHAHALRVGRIQAYRTPEGRRKDARLAAWTRHCRQLSDGLEKAEPAGRLIRQLLLERNETNAERTDAKIREKQAMLRRLHRRLHRRLRRPDAR